MRTSGKVPETWPTGGSDTASGLVEERWGRCRPALPISVGSWDLTRKRLRGRQCRHRSLSRDARFVFFTVFSPFLIVLRAPRPAQHAPRGHPSRCVGTGLRGNQPEAPAGPPSSSNTCRWGPLETPGCAAGPEGEAAFPSSRRVKSLREPSGGASTCSSASPWAPGRCPTGAAAAANVTGQSRAGPRAPTLRGSTETRPNPISAGEAGGDPESEARSRPRWTLVLRTGRAACKPPARGARAPVVLWPGASFRGFPCCLLVRLKRVCRSFLRSSCFLRFVWEIFSCSEVTETLHVLQRLQLCVPR